MHAKVLLFILSSLLILSSCQKKDDRASDDTQFRKANAYIDKGDYDSAISILSAMKTDSSEPKVSIALASAYAGRAGVKVEKYWNFVVGYQPLMNRKPDPDEPPAIDISSLPGPLPKEALQLVKNLNQNIQEFNRIQKKAALIPYVAYAQRPDLVKAIEALTDVETQGAHLYRAILELVLLKSAIEDAARLANHWAKNKFDLCSPDISKTSEWVTYSLHISDQILSDLRGAFPSRTEDFTKMQANVRSLRLPQTEQLCGLN